MKLKTFSKIDHSFHINTTNIEAKKVPTKQRQANWNEKTANREFQAKILFLSQDEIGALGNNEAELEPVPIPQSLSRLIKRFSRDQVLTERCQELIRGPKNWDFSGQRQAKTCVFVDKVYYFAEQR